MVNVTGELEKHEHHEPPPDGYKIVRMLHTINGAMDNRSTMQVFEAGKTYILPAGPHPKPDLAVEFIKTGYAEEVLFVRPEPGTDAKAAKPEKVEHQPVAKHDHAHASSDTTDPGTKWSGVSDDEAAEKQLAEANAAAQKVADKPAKEPAEELKDKPAAEE